MNLKITDIKAGETCGQYFVPRKTLEDALPSLIGLAVHIKFLTTKDGVIGIVKQAKVDEEGYIVVELDNKKKIDLSKKEGTEVNFLSNIVTEKRGVPKSLDSIIFYEVMVILPKEEFLRLRC